MNSFGRKKMMKNERICIVGAGYVGLSLGIVLGLKHDVTCFDIDEAKVQMINERISPIDEPYVQSAFKDDSLSLIATIDKDEAYQNQDFYIICLPIHAKSFDEHFDISSLRKVIKDILNVNENAHIVIKSTLPIGVSEKMQEEFSHKFILFSPEFLREQHAIYDTLYPSRIVVGGNKQDEEVAKMMKNYASLIQSCVLKNDVPIVFCSAKEAEAIKLFSNAFLATRVALFNEIDSYCLKDGNMSAKSIIAGMGMDERIGDFYNNPSFGYGGFCLPKDIAELTLDENYDGYIFKATKLANEKRVEDIANAIADKLEGEDDVVGVYRLTMKANTNDFRTSIIFSLIKALKARNIHLIIYEPSFGREKYDDILVYDRLEKFKEEAKIIVANRLDDNLEDVSAKVFSRDLKRID